MELVIVGEPMVANEELGPIVLGESKNKTVFPSTVRSMATSELACRPLASVIRDCLYGSTKLNCTGTVPVVPVMAKESSYNVPLPTELAAPTTAPGRSTLAKAEAVWEIGSAEPLASAHVTVAVEFADVPVSELETNWPRLFCACANDWAVGENMMEPLAGVMLRA